MLGSRGQLSSALNQIPLWDRICLGVEWMGGCGCQTGINPPPHCRACLKCGWVGPEFWLGYVSCATADIDLFSILSCVCAVVV